MPIALCDFDFCILKSAGVGEVADLLKGLRTRVGAPCEGGEGVIGGVGGATSGLLITVLCDDVASPTLVFSIFL